MKQLMLGIIAVASLAGGVYAEESEADVTAKGPPHAGGGEFVSRGQFVELLKSGCGSGATEESVLAGLKWLARHQSAGGCWSGSFGGRCQGTACSGEKPEAPEAGLTGLALLAYLGCGITHLNKMTYVDAVDGRTISYGEVTKNAIKWLISNQDAEGCFGGKTAGKYVLSHAIAALAMVEAYGLTQSALFRDSARKGLDFLVLAQNPSRGWRYGKTSGDSDSFVTAWCALALCIGRESGLTVGRATLDGAEAWFRAATDETTRKVGYDRAASPKNIEKGKNEDWDDHDTTTAAAVAVRILVGADRLETPLAEGVRYLEIDTPGAEKNSRDACFWHWGSLAMWQYRGPGDAAWRKWNEALVKALLPSQEKTGCAAGSWDPSQDRWGWAGGRVYVTAMNVLTLETYYRYRRIYAKK